MKHVKHPYLFAGTLVLLAAVVATTLYIYNGIHPAGTARQPDQSVNAQGLNRVDPTNSTNPLVVSRSGQTPTTPPQPTPQSTAKTATISTSTPTTATTPTPITASNSPATSTPTTTTHFQLIFSDDFNGTSLNPQWITYNGPHGGGQSYYDPQELQLQNGLLHIQMEKKTTNGLPYTTGGMGAMRLAQTYGKYEFRAKLPHGKGVGPYAILWPNSSGHGDVEVDLFESPPVNKDKVYFTNHGNGNPSQIIAPGNFADAYHVFTYEWTPNRVQFWIDGVDQGALTKNVPNFPMWFGIAVSSGDAFTGLPDATTALPVSLDLDWVHIYKYIG